MKAERKESHSKNGKTTKESKKSKKQASLEKKNGKRRSDEDASVNKK